jgi:hypothetical protein
MSSKYSLEAFNDDMKQLGGMIENFYTNTSSEKNKHSVKSKYKKHSKYQKGGEEPTEEEPTGEVEPSRDEEGNDKKNNKRKSKDIYDNTRRYRVLTVDGVIYPYYRPYKGKEPKDAAKKAGKFICKKLKINKPCNIKFELKEITRGSDKRTYGPYEGRYDKTLKKPVLKKFPGGKKFMAYKNGVFVVKLAKK